MYMDPASALAFWINTANTLALHACIIFGPSNSLERRVCMSVMVSCSTKLILH